MSNSNILCFCYSSNSFYLEWLLTMVVSDMKFGVGLSWFEEPTIVRTNNDLVNCTYILVFCRFFLFYYGNNILSKLFPILTLSMIDRFMVRFSSYVDSSHTWCFQLINIFLEIQFSVSRFYLWNWKIYYDDESMKILCYIWIQSPGK